MLILDVSEFTCDMTCSQLTQPSHFKPTISGILNFIEAHLWLLACKQSPCHCHQIWSWTTQTQQIQGRAMPSTFPDPQIPPSWFSSSPLTTTSICSPSTILNSFLRRAKVWSTAFPLRKSPLQYLWFTFFLSGVTVLNN